MPTLDELLDDLGAEADALDDVLGRLRPAAWDAPTPADGWSVRDQVAHLAHGEHLAALAASDPDGFAVELARLLDDLERVEDEMRTDESTDDLRARWRASVGATIAAVRTVGEDARIAWVTGPMGPASFVTARIMETWAHGRDVADALGVRMAPTARLRHVADLGVRTRRFAFRNRGAEPPSTDVRVELDGLTWGPPDAPDRVTGSLEDFCLVVTQRRHWRDTGLDASGPTAAAWLDIAQCFAGPPTTARRG
jgi:uncharacterized protein (TIGR03084 family)